MISKRLDIITKLLDDPTSVHPIGCNCAIKSRDIAHHALDCAYRALREIVAELRSVGVVAAHERKHDYASPRCWCGEANYPKRTADGGVKS